MVVGIVFENCDSVNIPGDAIKDMKVNFMSDTFNPLNDGVDRVIDFLHIELDMKKVKDMTTQFYESFMEKSPDEREKFLLVNRLKQYQDITQIEIIDDLEFANNTQKVEARYHVHWHDDDEYSNRYQHCFFSDNTIQIVIDSREKKKEFGTPQDYMWSLEKNIEFAKQYLNLDVDHPDTMNTYTVEQIRALMNQCLENIEKDFKKVKENSRLLEPVSIKEVAKEVAKEVENATMPDITINGQKYPGADYPNIPLACRYCRNHPINGGSGICHCTIGVQPLTM